jgi:hypothetical protein
MPRWQFLKSAFPAKAGIHASRDGAVEKWIPAFAGNADLRLGCNPNTGLQQQGGETMTVLLDPTAERSPSQRARLPRPERLDGLVIGLLDIAKARGDVFLDRLDERLQERGLAVKRYRKPTNTRTAPLPLQQQIATEVNLVIEGLSD